MAILTLVPRLFRAAPLLALLACSSNGSSSADPVAAARDRNEDKIDNADITKKQAADADFMVQASSNALLSVELGKLAQQPGSTPAVAAYGPRLVQQRLELLRALQGLARAKQLALPADLGEDAREAYHEVSAEAAGPARDKKLLKLIVKTQKQDEDAFDDIGDEGYDGDIRGLAAKYQPAIKEQLEAAGQVQDQVDELPK